MVNFDKVLTKIDSAELTELALDMGNIPSLHGHEDKVAEFVFKWMEENGLNPFKQDVANNRFNVIGNLKGEGNGTSLLYNGHLDNSQGLPESLWVVEEMRPEYTKAWLEGDTIIGNSVANDKGQIASFLIAAKAIHESGLKLKGDLLLTAVVGEIGSAPIDEFQGSQYLGKGIGSQFLVSGGIVGDYALVAETTDYAIVWTEAGDAWFKITVKGKGGIYTPYLERPYTSENNPSAIVRMNKVIDAIENWANEYQEKNKYEFSGGTVVPKVNIGAIRGGYPVRASQSAGICSIYVDVRLPPGKGLNEVKHELEHLLEPIGFPFAVEPYLFRMGYEGKGIEPLVDAAGVAHQYLFGKKPGMKASTPLTSMWRDINVFNGAGIPAITFGPGRAPGGLPDSMKVHDLVNGAKLYAIIACTLCNQPKKPQPQ